MILCLPKLLGDLGGQLLVAVILTRWIKTATVPSPTKCLEIHVCEHERNTKQHSRYCCLEEWLALGKDDKFLGQNTAQPPSHTRTPVPMHLCPLISVSAVQLMSVRWWKSPREEDSLSSSWGQLCSLTILPPPDSSMSMKYQDINSQ